MSNWTGGHKAPNRNGWNGSGATPADPPNYEALYPTCRGCGEPVEPGKPCRELISTRTPGHGMYLCSFHPECAPAVEDLAPDRVLGNR